MVRVLKTVGLIAVFFASQGRAAELVLPQGKGAFYADEAIELAVADGSWKASQRLNLVGQPPSAVEGSERQPRATVPYPRCSGSHFPNRIIR